MYKKYLIHLIACLACCTFSLSGCKKHEDDQNHEFAHSEGQHEESDHEHEDHLHLTPEEIELAHIEVEKAKGGSILLKTCVTGKVSLNQNKYIHVVPKTDGIALEIFANLGDKVQEGDILANLESKEMAESKAIYLAALRKKELRTNILEREQDLKNKKVSAEQDYFEALNLAEEAEVDLELAMHNLRTLGLSENEIAQFTNEQASNLRLYHLRAPTEGTIIKRHITPGEVLDSEHEAFLIADLKNLWVELSVHPKDLNEIKEGQSVAITTTANSQKGLAKIIYISPIIDEETRAGYVIAELDNADGTWRPGSFVCADIITDKIRAPIVLHKDAIQEIDGDHYVFVQIADGFEKRQVYPGKTDGENVEIISGLSKGEPYVSKNAFVLKVELSKTPHEH